jgi:DNA-directed RNA polymerase specialized sigma24 family protein
MRNTQQLCKGLETEFIWHTYNHELRDYINSRVHDQSETEDILQEVFIDIYNSIEMQQNHRDLRTFIYSTARKSILNHYCDYSEIEAMIESIETTQEHSVNQITTFLIPTYYTNTQAA